MREYITYKTQTVFKKTTNLKDSFKRLLYVFYLFGIIITSIQTIEGQQVFIPEIYTKENVYLFNHPNINNKKLHQKDTIKTTFKIPDIDFDFALYVGNAEINIIEFEDTTFYIGKYVSRKNIQDKEDDVHLILDKKYANQLGVISSYNKSCYPFFVDLIIISAENALANKSTMVFKSSLGMLICVLFTGGLFVMFFYFLGNYIIHKNVDFKNFMFYLLFLLIHQLIQSDSYLRLFIIFPENPIIYHQIIESFNILINVFYLIFIIKFLEIKVKSIHLYNLIVLIGYSLIIGGFLSLILAFITVDFELLKNVTLITLTISMILGLYITVKAYKILAPSASIFSITGSLVLFISVACEILYSHLIHNTFFWDIQSPMFYGMIPANFTHIGVFLLILFFAMALGIKYKEKDMLLLEFQEKELSSLKEKDYIEGKNLKLLKEDFATKQQLETQQEELFQNLKNEFGVIKSHLNPTFISNLIKSINLNILLKKNKLAKLQMTTFSAFIEQFIENYTKNTIAIKREINIIRLFLELEKIRTNNQFDYTINIDPMINKSAIFIPPFLLHPYLEHCIAQMDLNAKHLFEILINKSNNNLVINVSNTGNMKTPLPNKSKAITSRIQTSVIQAFNISSKKSSDITILWNEGDSPSIEITIPFEFLTPKVNYDNNIY